MTERIYTPEELRDMIPKMEAASGAFYPMACGTGNHAFIEFTGFMNEYLKMFKESVEQDLDPTTSNVHCGAPTLVMRAYNVEYIAEKFECIFGTAFKENPELIQGFCDAVFGKSIVTVDEEALARRKAARESAV